MKKLPFNLRRPARAFTLIELLVVIAIIAILAAMLFPVIGKAKQSAQKASAKQDMIKLGTAIKKYESDYNGRFPAPGASTGVSDTTFGVVPAGNPALGGLPPGTQFVSGNSNVIAVLMNWEKFPNGVNTLNVGKAYNPRGLGYLDANMAKDTASHGIGTDGEFRDPWGNSYFITMDTSLDEKCSDVVYARNIVSQDSGSTGFYGLSNPSNIVNQFTLPGQYMIWSLGPDGKFNSSKKAKDDVNQDNLLGWQQ